MELRTHLAVTISRHGKQYIAYAPALDLSTSGKSVAEVKRRFEEIVPLFIQELEDAGTTAEVLTELGWQKGGGSHRSPARWQPPEVMNREFEVRIPLAV